MSREISRRQFLGISALLVGGGALFGCRSGQDRPEPATVKTQVGEGGEIVVSVDTGDQSPNGGDIANDVDEAGIKVADPSGCARDTVATNQAALTPAGEAVFKDNPWSAAFKPQSNVVIPDTPACQVVAIQAPPAKNEQPPAPPKPNPPTQTEPGFWKKILGPLAGLSCVGGGAVATYVALIGPLWRNMKIRRQAEKKIKKRQEEMKRMLPVIRHVQGMAETDVNLHYAREALKEKLRGLISTTDEHKAALELLAHWALKNQFVTRLKAEILKQEFKAAIERLEEDKKRAGKTGGTTMIERILQSKTAPMRPNNTLYDFYWSSIDPNTAQKMSRPPSDQDSD